MAYQDHIPYEHAAICEARGLDPAKVWIATNSDGEIEAFVEEPRIAAGHVWSGSFALDISSGFYKRQIHKPGIDWKDSLLCPPKPEIVPEVGKWYRWKNNEDDIWLTGICRSCGCYKWNMDSETGVPYTLRRDEWTIAAELEISFTEKGAE